MGLMRVVVLLAVVVDALSETPHFPVWLDAGNTTAAWFDLIKTWDGSSFSSGGKTIYTGMNNHGAIHRFADPNFLQSFDDKLRAFNGPLARDSTGSVDRCGWPDKPADKAGSLQYHRRTAPLHIDFKNGLDPAELVVSFTKGCCQEDKYAKGNKFYRNLNIVKDTVNGQAKNVLALTAWNKDDPNSGCPGEGCHKLVTSSGTVATADLFASGKYEVIAKVAKASGLVWAIWTYHYEEHLPHDCANYSCWCKEMPKDVQVQNGCEFRADGSGKPCKYKNTCDNYTDGWSPDSPPSHVMTPAQCGAMHSESDPQFLGNDTFGGWATMVNHEIDIEIPANCVGSYSVCNKSDSGLPGVLSCAGDYSTTNLNNYIYSQHSGTGPMYSNACVRMANEDGSPRNLIADGEYHNYTIVWHTGPPSYTEFYIDGIYMGTNNVFAPTRGSRFYIAHWPAKNPVWNGRPNDWDGGHPGDNVEHNVTSYVSSIDITPFDEPNDIMAPTITDQPDGCTHNYKQKWAGVCHETWEKHSIQPDQPPHPPPAPPSICTTVPKPDGCACDHRFDCKSHDCGGIPPQCQGPFVPPPPPPTPTPAPTPPSGDCTTVPKPDGCQCLHKWDCKSYKCGGSPPKC